jgi:4-carboxymuconolactone decarboxylase
MTDYSFSPENPERAAKGNEITQFLLKADVGARTPLTAGARDFVFAEVWTRPGLDKRSRFWISLTSAVASGSPVAMGAYMKIALNTELATIAELREFALQLACYQGWPKGAHVDQLIDQLEAETKAS